MGHACVRHTTVTAAHAALTTTPAGQQGAGARPETGTCPHGEGLCRPTTGMTHRRVYKIFIRAFQGLVLLPGPLSLLFLRRVSAEKGALNPNCTLGELL